MENGNWLKLYRKIIDNPILQDPHLVQIFIYCLCKANYRERRIIFNGQEVILRPGEFISGRHEASKALHLKGIMWDRKLQILENLGILNRKVNNQFSIISIINWETYQAQQNEHEQQNEHRMNNGRTTDEHRQERKERKEKNIYSDEFETLWKEYPGGGSKSEAFKAWSSKEHPPLIEVLESIKKQKEYKKTLKARGKFCPEWPHGVTWINQKRWEEKLPELARSIQYGG